MSKTEQRPQLWRTVIVACLGLGFIIVLVGGLVLREHGPGNMGNGFIVGGMISLLLATFAVWRSATRPGSAGTFERAFTQSGDERDDTVLTHALAVLGLCALPLTGVAAYAIALGAEPAIVLALLMVAQLAIGTVSFVTVNRRI